MLFFSFVQQESTAKKATGSIGAVRCIVLVPTRELVNQVTAVFDLLCRSVGSELTIVGLGNDASASAQQPRLVGVVDVLICTPGRAAEHITMGHISLREVGPSIVVVDEADLVLSYGYEKDMVALSLALPSVFQCIMVSATGDLLEDLSGLLSKTLTRVAVDESVGLDKLSEYYIKGSDDEKFLIVYTMVKLKALKERTIFFVNSIEQGFRLKLFFERFSVKTAVLNPELPLRSRQSVINQFNAGAFDYLVATDTSEALAGSEAAGGDGEGEGDGDGDGDDRADGVNDGDGGEEGGAAKKAKGGKRKKKADPRSSTEYSSSRGVDFKAVAGVVNFDVPLTIVSYTHRVGRTARGHASGYSLTLVSDSEADTFATIAAEREAAKGTVIKPYQVNLSDLSGFRYRVDDMLRSVTKTAIKSARLLQLKAEIFNSETLKAHFEDKPVDKKALLSHDKVLAPGKALPHLKTIPFYLQPTERNEVTDAIKLNQLLGKKQEKKRKHQAKGNRNGAGAKRQKVQDPLRAIKKK